jgi:ribose transport system ATP-binding protein
MADATQPLLEVCEVSKSFPGVKALRSVSLQLGRGEVLAVIGENGAGKSTLMKILAGIQSPDSGELRVEGRRVALDSVTAATQAGIALIHQELNLADNLTVGDNIFLGREPRRWGWIDQSSLDRRASQALQRVGLSESPHQPLKKLTIGKQQLVEIAKALSIDARILIMDEPTSSLSGREAEQLFRLVKELRSQGMSVIYISHRLGEVKELADRVVVLRDGANAGHLDRDEINHEAMVRLMVGRDISQFYQRQPHQPGEELLQVRDVRTSAYPRQAVSFSIRRGEVVGMAGLVGSGRSELLRSIFGIDQRLAGSVAVNGKTLPAESPRAAMEAGLALVPEDRKQQGLVVGMPVRENISLASLDRHRWWGGLVDASLERSACRLMISKLLIKTPHDRQLAKFLSGGNQQKIVIGKWLLREPKLLLLDEPTRGIDIGAKQEIYRLMEDFARQGMGILFVSSEMEEILGMSDRVLVMHEGQIRGELDKTQLSEEAIMRLATGQE